MGYLLFDCDYMDLPAVKKLSDKEFRIWFPKYGRQNHKLAYSVAYRIVRDLPLYAPDSARMKLWNKLDPAMQKIYLEDARRRGGGEHGLGQT